MHSLRGAQFGSVHGLLGRGARRADVIALLQLGEDIQLALPVDVDLSGAGSAFLEAVLSHEADGSALDYGFDPKRALSAAADRLLAAPAPSLEAEQVLLSTEAAQAAHFETQAHLRQNPEFIVADMMRSSTRFDHSALERKVQSIFGKLEGESFNAARFAEQAIDEGLSSGVLLAAERSIYDGAQLYVTRVQAELEVRALDVGKAMAAQRSNRLICQPLFAKATATAPPARPHPMTATWCGFCAVTQSIRLALEAHSPALRRHHPRRNDFPFDEPSIGARAHPQGSSGSR